MVNTTLEREIPGIVPSDGKNFAHINSKELDKAKKKLAVPITEYIFGGSIDGKTIEISSVSGEAPQHIRRRSIKKKHRKH